MKAKPFVKWVGGKGQLIEQLEALLPADFDRWENVTYIEPFVGGGAMLFHMLQKHKNIKAAVINDINADLTTCYKVVRNTLAISALKQSAMFQTKVRLTTLPANTAMMYTTR